MSQAGDAVQKMFTLEIQTETEFQAESQVEKGNRMSYT